MQWCSALWKKLHGQGAVPPSAPPTGRARLVLPGNTEVLLPSTGLTVGRATMARAVPVADLIYISHQHLTIASEGGRYTVTDLDSLNGTRVNGVEIRGQGKKPLEDGDRITIAGVATVVFKVR